MTGAGHADEFFAGRPPGWNEHLGMTFPAASADSVTATLRVGEAHLAADGGIHSGVYASIAEAAASLGAALHVRGQGRAVLGMTNNTRTFRRVGRGTELVAQALPEHASATEESWSVVIRDVTATEHEVARATVRLFVIEALPQDGVSRSAV